jgi:protein arginine N-methyltransferase 2
MDDDDPLTSINVDLSAQSLLLASANHDLDAIRELLKEVPASVQDPDTGYTPLHTAITACEREQINGFHDEENDNREEELAKAADTVRLLLQSGAIWNDLDANDETPGCVAED